MKDPTIAVAKTIRFRYVNIASFRQLFLLIFDIAARNATLNIYISLAENDYLFIIKTGHVHDDPPGTDSSFEDVRKSV